MLQWVVSDEVSEVSKWVSQERSGTSIAMFLVVVDYSYSYRCFLSQFALLCDVVCDVAELFLDLPHRLEIGRTVEGIPTQQQELITTTTVVDGGGEE